MQQDPIEKKIKKNIIWGVNRKFRFLGSIKKKSRIKKCLFWTLFDKNEKRRVDSEKKSLPY